MGTAAKQKIYHRETAAPDGIVEGFVIGILGMNTGGVFDQHMPDRLEVACIRGAQQGPCIGAPDGIVKIKGLWQHGFKR
jgi:hypothetical protein